MLERNKVAFDIYDVDKDGVISIIDLMSLSANVNKNSEFFGEI
jgi:Ca2+-binding EF-hand superfamily protein